MTLFGANRGAKSEMMVRINSLWSAFSGARRSVIGAANGLLLMPEGQQLSAPYIDKLLNHNRINPISQSLIVYC